MQIEAAEKPSHTSTNLDGNAIGGRRRQADAGYYVVHILLSTSGTSRYVGRMHHLRLLQTAQLSNWSRYSSTNSYHGASGVDVAIPYSLAGRTKTTFQVSAGTLQVIIGPPSGGLTGA